MDLPSIYHKYWPRLDSWCTQTEEFLRQLKCIGQTPLNAGHCTAECRRAQATRGGCGHHIYADRSPHIWRSPHVWGSVTIHLEVTTYMGIGHHIYGGHHMYGDRYHIYGGHHIYGDRHHIHTGHHTTADRSPHMEDTAYVEIGHHICGCHHICGDRSPHI
jgi:hypothetical protein